MTPNEQHQSLRKNGGGSQASSTLYLIHRTSDRTSEGRRIAAAIVSQTDANRSLGERGIHPDILELSPPDGKERIGIGQVREIIRQAQYAPVQAPFKICLVPKAEALTVEAANALLKILEEPPRGLRFLLFAEHPSDLLPTIVSRSRLIRMPLASVHELQERLVAAGYAAPSARWLSRLAFRDGELDHLIARPFDVDAHLRTLTTELANADLPSLLDACLGEDPVLRHQAFLLLLQRIAERDPHLLTSGIRILGSQSRDVLARFFHELLSAAFHVLRMISSDTDGPDAFAHAVQDRWTPSQLRAFCRSTDEAHRQHLVYGPVEGILLSLFLPEGEGHDS